MCEQMKRVMIKSAREVCDSVRVGDRTQNVWWNDEVKPEVRRNEAD